MKIQCDVCDKDEASVFCTADEAALCDACDHRVHHANKLASKHHRFSLLQPPPNQLPLCDICQERRAFLFCQQDRAILCRDCDFPIHSANEHTKKHNRFLLTGVKLSVTSTLYKSSSSSTSSLTNGDSHSVPDFKSQPLVKKPVAASPPLSSSSPPSVCKNSSTTQIMATADKSGENWVEGVGCGPCSTSSISEYLIETLPGWHFEDFLDSSTPPFGFSSKTDDGMLPFLDAELESNLGSISSENLGVWVPQTPSPFYPSDTMSGVNGFKEMEVANIKVNRGGWIDDGFIVPQMSPPSTGSKRSRSFW